MSDPNAPTIVASELSYSECAGLVDYLRDRGFKARAWGANVAALEAIYVGGLSAQVVVRESEAGPARQAVAEFRRDPAANRVRPLTRR
jgi:hypothetical protein